MANNLIDIIIRAQDRASREFRRLRSEIEALNQTAHTLTDIGQGLSLAGAGIAAGLGYAVKTAGDFEQAVVNLGSVMGRSYGQMQDLANMAREFGRTTTYSATESAKAMQLIASYGYENARVLKEHTAVAMKLATAQAYDLDLTTEILISTMKNFARQGYTSARVADILTQSANLSSASLDKFRYSLKYVAPVANALGISLEDMVAQMSMLYDAGLSAETVGTSLRGIWESLVNPTSKAKDVLKKYGLTVDEVNPKTQKMADILDRLKNLSQQDIFTIFGVESAPAFMAMLDQGSQRLRQLEQAYKDSAGALNRQYNTQLKTFNNQLQITKNKLQDVAIEIGNYLMPYVRKFLSLVNQLTDWFRNLSPETKKFIADVLAMGSALLMLSGTVLMIGGAFLKLKATLKEFKWFLEGLAKIPTVASALEGLGKVLSFLRTGFAQIGEAIAGVASFLIDNPIGLAILAIIAVLTALYFAWKNNWFGIRDIVNQAWSWISSTFNRIVSGVSQFINDVVTWFQNFNLLQTLQSAWNGIVEWVSSLWQSIKDTIYNFLLQILMDTGQSATEAKTTLQNAWNNLVAFFQGIGNVLYYLFIWPFQQGWQFISQAVTWIGQVIANGWNWIVSITSSIWNSLVIVISNAIATVKSWIMTGLAPIMPYVSAVWNAIRTITSAVWSGIKAVIQGALSVIRGIIQGVLGAVRAIWQGHWNTIKAVAQAIWSGIKAVIQSAISIIKNIIALGINLIAGNWKGAWNNVKNIASSVWGAIKGVVRAGLNAVVALIRGAIGTFASAGRALMQALANGIRSAVGAVYGAVEGVMAKARRLLGFSDAKEGPFSNVTYSGYATMVAFAKGVTQAKTLLARSIGGTLASALSGGTAGAFGINQVGRLGFAGAGSLSEPSHQNFNITINIHGGGDNINPRILARQIMEEIQKQMVR